MNKATFITENQTLTIKRAFSAPISLVWRVWTEAELLDQWWAPKPWKSETSHMEFREGGYRFYAMVSPEGEKLWGRTNFETIRKPTEFTGTDIFCDEKGLPKDTMPAAKFSNQFFDQGDQTEVVIVTIYDSEESLQKMIEMGMNEGWELVFTTLDELFTEMTSS